MHLVAGLLLVLSTVLNLLMGGGLLLSSRAEALKARTDAGDLSAVAGDLAPAETLERDRQKAEERMDMSTAHRNLGLGILVLVVAVLQLAAAVLTFLRRARSFVLTIIVLSVLAVVLAFLLSGFSISGAVALVPLVLAFIFLLSRRPGAVPKPS